MRGKGKKKVYAIVKGGVIESISAAFPSGARRLDDNSWFKPADRRAWTQEEMALVGMMPVVDTPRPADTATQTTDRTVEMVNGSPTVVWVWRDLTTEEKDDATEEEIDLRLVSVHLVNLQTLLNTANTQINSAPAPYIKDCARALRSVIRKVERLLDAVE